VSRSGRAELGVDGTRVAVSLLAPDGDIVAGAPLTVRCEIEPEDGAALFLLVSGDSATGRPAGVSFGAQGAGVELVDPARDAVNIGGPAGAVPLAAGQPFSQELLVNQFLTLERLADEIPEGSTATVTLVLRRELQIGRDQAGAMRAPAQAAEVELELGFRGDPGELRRIADRLADEVAADTAPGSVAREQALTTLLALRTPHAAERLAELRDHPDEGVRARVS